MRGKSEKSTSLAGLGSRIRRARTRLELTQEALANQASLSMSTLSKIETGDSTPTLEVLLRISAAVGQTPDQLLDWNAPPLKGEARRKASLTDELSTIISSLPTDQLSALVALLRR